MSKKIFLELNTVAFDDVIVHTLPKHKKAEKEVVPRFSERFTKLTGNLKFFFKDKILTSLTGDKAIKLVYDSTSTSPVSSLVKSITATSNAKARISDSKKIAQFLFDTQAGANNEGILLVIPCDVNRKPALILIKLEMDSGAQLVLNEKLKSFDIREVEDLMLTKKTKVYKVALLLNRVLQGVDFDGIVADYQIDAKAKEEVKSWYINKFLGCIPYLDPKIVTQHFYNFTKAFIDTIDDDIKKAKYHQDLNSYVQKNQSTLSPKEFADDYLSSTGERNRYKSFLDEKQFSFDGFLKDVSQIERRIHEMSLEFMNDVVITTKTGTLEDKVKLTKTDDGQTKAEITSKIRKVK
jgi:hypothetical protein